MEEPLGVCNRCNGGLYPDCCLDTARSILAKQEKCKKEKASLESIGELMGLLLEFTNLPVEAQKAALKEREEKKIDCCLEKKRPLKGWSDYEAKDMR